MLFCHNHRTIVVGGESNAVDEGAKGVPLFDTVRADDGDVGGPMSIGRQN